MICAKWSHYIALTNKYTKTLLPPDSLDVELTTTSVTSSRKQPKRLSHAGIETTIFRVVMQSVNPSVKPFCSLLRETTQVWLLQLCLSNLRWILEIAKLPRKRRDRWSDAVRSIDFSHSGRKAWSILSNLTGRLRHSPRHCAVKAGVSNSNSLTCQFLFYNFLACQRLVNYH